MVPSKQFYVRVSQDGSVLYSLRFGLFVLRLKTENKNFRLKLKLQCWMNLQDFPFDSQVCHIQIASCKI